MSDKYDEDNWDIDRPHKTYMHHDVLLEDDGYGNWGIAEVQPIHDVNLMLFAGDLESLIAKVDHSIIEPRERIKKMKTYEVTITSRFLVTTDNINRIEECYTPASLEGCWISGVIDLPDEQIKKTFESFGVTNVWLPIKGETK